MTVFIFNRHLLFIDDNNTGVKANASAVRVDINSLYKFKTALGSGTYSVVKLATDRQTGEEVAIKVITKSQLSGDDTVSLNVGMEKERMKYFCCHLDRCYY